MQWASRLEDALPEAEIDGPFTESKELIAGFVIVAGESMADAMRWASRYLDVVETDEVDVLECSWRSRASPSVRRKIRRR